MTNQLLIQDLTNFLDQSPTPWHAVESASARLLEQGFSLLPEHDYWHLEPGKKYFAIRNGTSLCAFYTPRKPPKQIQLLASHTDSPGFKLRPNAEFRKNQAVFLGVEIYGSPLLSSWLNRDLGIAGTALYLNSKGQMKESLVRLEQHPVTIPQLAIHLDRNVNEKGVQLNKQEHLHALAGVQGSLHEASFLETALRDQLDLAKLITHDLFLYPLEKASLIGFQQSLLASYRIDSLSSVHAALTALLHQTDPQDEVLNMVIFWDHEEVGSQTAQGAHSTFFSQTAEKIVNGYGGTREDYFLMLNRSLCISIDLAHALHPSYSEKHDLQHQPFLGEGVVVKTNAQQKYASTARTLQPIHHAASLKELKLQQFSSRNDMPCGSTIGPLHAYRTGMPTADIGCAQLSMHSCRELMACQDHIDLCLLLETIFEQSME